MSLLGNLLWLLCGGLLSGLSWCVTGCLWCVTIIGIPWGMQCFKFAALAFCPFGKEVEFGGNPGSLLLNLVWMLISGIPMALINAAAGCLLCLTIVGIPFGMQFFKIARLALMPFGSIVYKM